MGGSWGSATIPFFSFSSPINNWVVDRATFIIDTTTLCYNSSHVSSAGAIRCTHVLTWDGTQLHNNNDVSIVRQLEGSQWANCRQWPCCIYPDVMNFPHLIAMASGGSATIWGMGQVGFTGTLQYLGLNTGTGENLNNDVLQIYNTIDITILEGTV